MENSLLTAIKDNDIPLVEWLGHQITDWLWPIARASCDDTHGRSPEREMLVRNGIFVRDPKQPLAQRGLIGGMGGI